MTNSKLIIALTKGRILEETLPLFERAGIVPKENLKESRKLIFETNMGSAVYTTPIPHDGVLYIVSRNKLFAIEK